MYEVEKGSESCYYCILFFFFNMSFQIALNRNGSFGYAMLVKIIYIFLIRPLIIINVNILIKRAKMAGEDWEKAGEENLPCLQVN